MINLLLFTFIFTFARSFYVPGVSPTEFKKGDKIPVRAIKLSSSITQVPYEYYHLPFCTPDVGEVRYHSLNFGEILRGDKIVATPYKINMLTDVSCLQVCSEQQMSSDKVNQFINLIKNEYLVYMTVDDLPIVVSSPVMNSQHEFGYRVGYINKDTYLNNHLSFLIKYHEMNDHYRVVGVTVKPSSYNNLNSSIANGACTITDNKKSPKMLVRDTETSVVFSYSVSWERSDIEWTSRWDVYLDAGDGQIHWFSIINSIIIIIFLSGVMAVILLKILRRDIALYNREDDCEEMIEESGWKLVHGDVFRPPQRSALLAAFVGSGVQLLCMMFIVLFFAMLGMLSPASRGALLSCAIFSFVFMGALAGYYAGRIYRTMSGCHWKSAALLTGILYPAIILGAGFVINFILWCKRSSAALSFVTMFSLLCLWLLISLPLVFGGFFFGVRKRPYAQPVRTNQIPRAIPDRKIHQNIFIATLSCGVLPFGSVFIELFFIFNAIWNRQIYYLFGFLFIVFIILIISCIQVAILTAYFQLCSEDYHWWWRSFISSGGVAFYVFLYSIYYFLTRLEINNFVSLLIYFGYSFMMVSTFWILTGTIGFLATFTFLRKIYAAIKID